MLIQCPHCDCFIEVEALNCCMFVHGVYVKSDTFIQINQHIHEGELVNLTKIYKTHGCLGAFKIQIWDNDTLLKDGNDGRQIELNDKYKIKILKCRYGL